MSAHCSCPPMCFGIKVAQIECHNKTIVQLRREVEQVSRQSQNWKGHFLRTEEARCLLEAKIMELTASSDHNQPNEGDATSV